MNNNEKLTITLNVAGDKFTLNIHRQDEELYRKASKIIEEQMNRFRTRYGEAVADKSLKMAALTIALNLVKTEDKQDAGPVFDRLERLDSELINLLK